MFMCRIVLLITCLIVNIVSWSQNMVRGTIEDKATHEPLIGVTISLTSSDTQQVILTTLTDENGSFELVADQAASLLIIEHIGYETQVMPIILEENREPISILLQPGGANKIEEVIVRTVQNKESINALYSAQRKAASVSDGISADIIKKSPDRNTGEVLKRVSGTTIQDGKFVVVRGLNDRYNTALIDKSILPSTEPNRKAFSFDIIPAGMIDNIVITKSSTPDLPGDFAGGAIQIITKEIPDESYNQISIGSGYNTASTGKAFLSGYKSGTDFIGFDDGSRKLPASLPSSQDLSNRNPSVKESAELLHTFNNDYAVRTRTALPSINLQGGLGRTYSLKGNNRWGYSAGLSYEHNERIKPNILRRYDGYDYTDNVYTYSSTIGGLFNTAYYFGSNKIAFKTLYNRVFDDNFLYREGYNNSSSSNIQYYAFDLIQKSLLKTTLSGEHDLRREKDRLTWTISYNHIANNQPDQRKVLYAQLENSNNPFSADLGTVGKANNRLFGQLDERILNLATDYSLAFDFLQKSSLKIGALALLRHRNFNNRYLGAVLNPTYSDDQMEVRTQPIAQLFNENAINNGAFLLRDETTVGDAYTALATTTAAYAMLDHQINPSLRLVWGLRVESFNIDLETREKTEVSNRWLDFLPSVNLCFALNGASNLRLAYFRSTVRPEMRELANLGYYDYDLSATWTGNTALKRSRIDNFDLKYEWFPHSGEILAASLFYKKFNNTLENEVYGDASAYNINPQNFAKAHSAGIEFEVRKKLDFISSRRIFKNLSVYTNVAYIHSRVILDEPIFINGQSVSSRALSGQSPFMVNASLGYTSSNGKLQLNALYNIIGKRIFLVGQGRLGHVYEAPRSLLDVQASYALNKKCTLRLNIKDLLNQPILFYFDQNVNGRFDQPLTADRANLSSKSDWTLQQYRPGTNVSLSLNYNF